MASKKSNIGIVFGVIGVFSPLLFWAITITLFTEVFERSVGATPLSQAYLFAIPAFITLCLAVAATLAVGRAARNAWKMTFEGES